MRVRFLGQYLHISTVALVIIETVLFFLVLIAAALARFGPDAAAIHRSLGALWPRAVLFCLAVTSSMLAFGLYSSRQRARSVGILIRVGAAIGAGTVATALCFYVFPELGIGRGVLGIAAAFAVAVTAASRLGFSYLVGDAPFKRRVLVYGAGRVASAVAMLRRRSDQRGFVPVGFVPNDGEETFVPADRLIDSRAELLDICARYAIDEVVVAMDDRRHEFPLRDLLDCKLAGIDVTEVLTFLERETGQVRIDVLNPSWIIFGEGFRRGSLRLITARTLDLMIACLLLLLTSPLMLAMLLAIRVEDGWGAPVFYRQLRVGLAGTRFELLKFRSMRPDAEAPGQARWAQKNDPRVTRVGALTRKVRIDELPQLINVLRGEMSIVGPRPERPEFVADLAEKIPYYVQRHSVKPGITGWAQLCYPYGASERDAFKKLQYDLYYIKNNGLMFDLSILVQTAEVVFLGKGAR